jgi:hypothetical protein
MSDQEPEREKAEREQADAVIALIRQCRELNMENFNLRTREFVSRRKTGKLAAAGAGATAASVATPASAATAATPAASASAAESQSDDMERGICETLTPLPPDVVRAAVCARRRTCDES